MGNNRHIIDMNDELEPIKIDNDVIHQAALMYHHIKDNNIQVEEFIKWVNDLLHKFSSNEY